MATKAQIASRVLQKLMVLEHGETMDSGDQTIVEAAYDAAYGLLSASRLTTWGSADNIPVAAELPIINYVAEQVKGAFVVPQVLIQTLPFEAEKALSDLAILIAPDYVSDDIPAEYY